jgi:hypothetical protein
MDLGLLFNAVLVFEVKSRKETALSVSFPKPPSAGLQ